MIHLLSILLWTATLVDQDAVLCDADGACVRLCDNATVQVQVITVVPCFSCRYTIHCPDGAFVVFSNGFE